MYPVDQFVGGYLDLWLPLLRVHNRIPRIKLDVLLVEKWLYAFFKILRVQWVDCLHFSLAYGLCLILFGIIYVATDVDLRPSFIYLLLIYQLFLQLFLNQVPLVYLLLV